jgi:hypothetical protein
MAQSGAICQALRHSANQLWINQGLVALHIDHNRIVR